MRAKYVRVEIASARGVAARWERERFRDGKWCRDQDQGICEGLHALGSNPSIADAAEVIGNKSWTYLSCDGCSDYVERAVRLGEEYSDGKIYCLTCIEEAHQAMIGESK